MVTLIIILFVIFVVLLIMSCKTVPQSSMYIIESFGKYSDTLGAGLHFVPPFIKTVRKKVSLQEQCYDVPPQNVITKDNVQIKADSFIFFKVFEPKNFTYGVANPAQALSTMCTSTLRDQIGRMDLETCLSSRDKISSEVTRILDEATDKWGIKVTRVEIKTFEPPRNILESMERQMKAEREKREQLIRAEAAKAASILDAEKNKAVQVMNAQAARDAAELNAEAARISMVKKAEAEREAALLKADAEKAVRIKAAEAEAESVRIVEAARADGIRAVNAAAPSEAVLRLKAYDAFKIASNGQATKIIIPSDMQGIVGMASAIKETLRH